MLRRNALIVIIVAVIACLSTVLYLRFNAKPHNTLTRNREIEIKAFEQKDPTICSQIKGNSYTFGGADEETTINQTQARQECQQNIQRNFEPELISARKLLHAL